MPVVYLDSSEDLRLAPYRNLAGKPRQPDGQRFVVEGRFLVERLLSSRFATESILTDATRLGSLRSDIDERTTIFVLPDERIDQLVGFQFHRGMLACGRRSTLPTWPDLVVPGPAPFMMVICSQVVDPANLGGILRNCAAFGVQAVLLGPGTADPFSRRVLRVSMGAAFCIPIATSNNLAADLNELAINHRVTLLATVLDDDAESLAGIEPISRVGLVIGNEGFGLSAETVRICQRKVTIPIQSRVDSLNAAVASGVFLYHLSQNDRNDG